MRDAVSWMRAALAVALVTGGMLVLGSGTAWAHQDVDVGPYTLAIGFGQEPAYSGTENSLQVLVSRGEEAVVDITDSLKAEVSFGDQTMALSLEPFFEVGEFGTPGDYRAFFIPTRPGDYTFTLSGDIHGTVVDVTVTSGPDTFSSVQDPTQAEFPVKDPTVGQVAERVDREVPRLTSAIDDAATSATAAHDAASSTRTITWIALGVGVVALALSGVSLARDRRKS